MAEELRTQGERLARLEGRCGLMHGDGREQTSLFKGSDQKDIRAMFRLALRHWKVTAVLLGFIFIALRQQMNASQAAQNQQTLKDLIKWVTTP